MKVLASLVVQLYFWSLSWQTHTPTPIFPLAILINADVLRSKLDKKTLLEGYMPYDDVLHFLYKRCQKLVQKMVRQLPTNLSQYDSDYLLNIAYGLIENPDNFFRDFNFYQVKLEYFNPTLIKYTDRKIKYGIYEVLRKQTGLETIGRSNLGLASRSSSKRVKEALVKQGKIEPMLSQYMLAWRCFIEFKKSTRLSANNYKNKEFQAIATLYSQHNLKMNLQSVDEKTIEQWLNSIGADIRYLLNNSYNNREREYYCLNKYLEENKCVKELADKLLNKLNYILLTINKFEEKKLLFYFHGLKLKQREIALEFNKSQSTISRQLATLYQHLWFPIIDWIKQNMEEEFPINLISAELRGGISSESLEYLTILLDEYYEDQLNQLLNQCSQNSSYSHSIPDKADWLAGQIQERFDIIISQSLIDKLLY